MKKFTKRVLSFSISLSLIIGSQVGTVAAASKKAEAVKLATGLGIQTSIGSSKDAADSKTNGTAQVDSLIAVLTVDTATGKIVKCEFDAAQTKVNFNNKGVVQSDKKAEVKTKMELGSDYGMLKNSKIEKEWNEQAEAFAEWTIGKTPAEVAKLKTKKVDDNHLAVPDVADLTSSVTITVGDFLQAVTKAAENLAESTEVAGEYTTGLGVVTSIASSKDATSSAAGTGQVDSVIAAVTLDADGVIVQCSIDSAQTKVAFDAKGVVTADKKAEVKSKMELGSDYGMIKNSKIEKEWFEQANALEEWVIGKTIKEVKALKTKKVDDSHTAVPDVPELTSSVTITVGDYLAAIEKAVENAK